MKKILTVIAAAISMHNCFAQDVSWGVSAGMSFASMRSEFEGEKDHSGFHPGITAGVFLDAGLSHNFSFMPALNFVQKGGQETDGDMKLTVTTNYLEVPLNFVFKSPGKGARLMIGAGPVLSYGIGGKAKIKDSDVSVSSKLKFGSGADDDYKPFEMGANLLLGVELENGISISGNYNLGLSNIANYDGGKEKTSYIGIRVGYLFKSIKRRA